MLHLNIYTFIKIARRNKNNFPIKAQTNNFSKSSGNSKTFRFSQTEKLYKHEF